MLTDVHCHPFDLAGCLQNAEKERRRLSVIAAASACRFEEFAHNENLAHRAASENTVPLLPCFAIHPQMFRGEKGQKEAGDEHLSVLDKLASEKRIAAVGECGFDLFNETFRETEALQEKFFKAQTEIALRFNLPVVLHVRRAMHKIFAVSNILKKCRAVIFHSWSGALEEGEALLRRGVNAYFSFGNTILLNHKQAIRCCALFPADRLLTETDAPFQPQRGENFSCWKNLPQIIETAAALRHEAGSSDSIKLESQIETNFKNIFEIN
ncbi:MAG: TatD family hydrolase [Treponema sp.]|jgi:TatD DNase family protein|nr:TatD family hydrolase [Treponema sp.]